MPGPAPQSAAAKRARGNPGKRAIVDVPAVDMPVVVSDATPHRALAPAALDVWNQLAPELQRTNVLRATDSNSLSRYCADVAEYWAITARLKKSGLTYQVKSLHGTYQRLNPLFTVQERIGARLIAFEDRFGLSPQARQALMVRAAQIASQQGNLPFGGQTPEDTAGKGAQAASPIGIFGAPPPTTH